MYLWHKTYYSKQINAKQKDANDQVSGIVIYVCEKNMYTQNLEQNFWCNYEFPNSGIIVKLEEVREEKEGGRGSSG